ncbi:GNAT family N-acetyltransferase [Massilia pinisoli]|uniref:GNAT family N-acetyltransferase n=1 Tax=Massilia pinisoli TaxID=1772194 RepID=A0ABT1ZNS3_9BURK|nr:GNAT family N-acetyltransferase [Massilia pinisoli]MCS0581561.1 GNAT family N-acetyltransferase [Massilia pinisoli]
MYQSPQFFNYLIDIDQGQEASYELFVIRRRGDYAIVGFVPVRTLGCDLDFRFGPVSLFKRALRACQILGSVPLLAPTDERLAEFVMKQLFARYAKCDVLYMQAMPEEMSTTLTRCAGVSAYILNGWRPCHTQPMPESVDAYLQKFSAKKRYNLSCQVCLLTGAAGPLQVLRIETPDDVTHLLNAMDAVCPSPAVARDTERLRFEKLARHGLLLSYVIRCGNEDVAVVLGSRSPRVWHVHKIVGQQKYMRLSVGMSAMHLAVLDVLANFTFRLIDYGYGTPNAEFRSTHVLKSRGQVLLHRSRSLMGLLLTFHDKYNTMNEALIRRITSAKNGAHNASRPSKRRCQRSGRRQALPDRLTSVDMRLPHINGTPGAKTRCLRLAPPLSQL